MSAHGDDAARFAAILPRHSCSLHIVHNEHKALYRTIEDYISTDVADDQWATPQSRSRAIETDSLWELHWYPDTPVGFYRICGASLPEVIVAAQFVDTIPPEAPPAT